MNALTKSGKRRINLLNEGLVAFHEALNADSIALSRVQICVINAGGPTLKPELIMDWTDATDFRPFKLVANNATPLGAATNLALEVIESQKITLRQYGISYTRPWLFMLTDGEPTDSLIWDSASDAARKAEAAGKLEIFPIGIGAGTHSELAKVSIRPPIQMDEVEFQNLFIWLSASLSQMSRSVPGESVELPPTDPWASVRL